MKGNKYMLFRDFIKGQCGLRGITLKKMCEDCDINYLNFSATYRTRRTDARILVRLAHYFDVSVEDLIMMEVC